MLFRSGPREKVGAHAPTLTSIPTSSHTTLGQSLHSRPCHSSPARQSGSRHAQTKTQSSCSPLLSTHRPSSLIQHHASTRALNPLFTLRLNHISSLTLAPKWRSPERCQRTSSHVPHNQSNQVVHVSNSRAQCPESEYSNPK